jgi:hypothetical protein
MGLTSTFLVTPTPLVLDVANDGLPTLVNVHVFDGNLLLALAAMAVKRLKQSGVGAGKLAWF